MAVARYVFAVSFGLAVQAAGGATAAELGRRRCDVAMSGWPARPDGEGDGHAWVSPPSTTSPAPLT